MFKNLPNRILQQSQHRPRRRLKKLSELRYGNENKTAWPSSS